MKTIHVPLKEKSYDVIIKKGLLNDISDYIDSKKEIVIITDKNIPLKYVNTVKSKLNVLHVLTLNPGESLKCFTEVESVINKLIELKVTRNITLVALGGGVVGDFTGFVASIYMRGVDFIQIPTSLLSQVDSSVGGKVGINTDFMKNAVGSFYQPKIVLIDPNTLETLEKRHFNNGMAELIKHGVIAGKGLFIDILNNDVMQNIDELIYQSITIKKNIVIQDIEDKGIRQILNFGHTIGHAIEQHSNYGLLHGEAISIGMVMMSKGTTYEKDLLSILNKYNLPTSYAYNLDDLYEYIKTDKKVTEKNLNIILAEEVGNGFIKQINIEEIKKYL